MLAEMFLAAALSCPGTSVADLQAVAAEPPVDVMAPFDAATEKLLSGPGYLVYGITGPGVGKDLIALVLTKDGCVLDLKIMPLHDFELLLEQHKA